MKKRILLPTDFSSNADNAINYAVELFKREDCEFYILHSNYLPGHSKDKLLSPEPTETQLNEVKAIAKEKMEKLKVHVRFHENNHKHKFHFLNEFGSLIEVLKNTVEKEDIKLIIMGTRGETDNKNEVLGSNAINTMEKVRNCPVLAIPGNTNFKGLNEIVFPTSFKTHYKENELETLIQISQLASAPIRVLHVQKENDLSKEQIENKALLNKILASINFTHHKLFNLSLQDGVRCFAQSRESEMIAFINKKHNFFGSVFSNPMVKDLGQNANVPVLALHDLRN